MFKRWSTTLMSAAALVAGLLSVFPAGAQASQNLLANPGFEGTYRPYTYPDGQTISEFHIADGWGPWFSPDQRRPEYKPASYSYNGSKAQQFFTSYSTHTAGVWQRVENATPGKTYRFSIAVYIWSSAEGDIYQSAIPGNANVRVGIDPTGGINPFANTVVWSEFARFYDEWRVLSVDAVAQGKALTVFVWSSPEFPVQHNDIALDEAFLGLATGAPAPGRPAATTTTATPTTTQPAAPVANPTGITLWPTDDLRLRAYIYGPTLGVIPAGTEVAVLGRSADRNWTLVDYNGQRGWVASWLAIYSVNFDTIPVVPTE